MRLLIDFDIKCFDDESVQIALEKCMKLCEGCNRSLEQCLISQNECLIKNAIEALSGMIRLGKGNRRYEEVGRI